MSNMQRYLAEKYMSGPKADAILAKDPAVKKKKRKHGTEKHKSGGIGIVDEDAGWGRSLQTEEDADDAAEAVVASDRTFKKRKVATAEEGGGGGGWVSLPPSGVEGAEPEPEDEKPVIVNEPARSGGLMTHADLQKQFASQMSVQNSKDDEPTPEQQETVYRDASGRKVDTKAAKADAVRRKREEEEKEAKRMEWGKGVVQREEAQQRRREMELERGKGFERRRDDEALNQTQKEELRWNDPAAAFLSKAQKKGPKKPEYKGPPPPPNRFGIKPGYRWDGVDRSNGFEKKYFQRQNERQRKGQEAYEWSVDDM